MAHNKYYIVNSNDINLPQIETVIVGLPATQRYSLDNTKIVVKLHSDDHTEYPFLLTYSPLNNEQTLVIMASAEWTSPEIL
jgi:hypothetical protein